MKKLKNILQYDIIIYILLFISVCFTITKINIKDTSIYNDNMNVINGYIREYKLTDKKITIYLKSKENIIVNYYYKNKKEIDNLSYNDYIQIYGIFSKPKNNTNINLFNYKKYLLSRKINYIVTANKVDLIQKNKNIFFKIKHKILERINSCEKTGSYIKAFIFADKNDIDMRNYQMLGISHLMAVSGMHVSLVSIILLKLFSFLKNEKKYLIVSIFLLFYLFLTNYCVSMIRSVLQFLFFYFNKRFKLNIKNINIILFIFSILLLYNSFFVYNVGFIFSFIISFSLVKYNNLISKGNYLKRLLKISIISFLVSIPILINNYNQINILSIIFNLLYVPFFSFIIFPLSILTLFIPYLDNINYFFILLLENISNFLIRIDFATINIAKLPLFFIVIYYSLLYLLLLNINYKKIFLLIIILILFYFYKKIVFYPEVLFFDVSQGDSALIRIKDKNIMIDVGGSIMSEFGIAKNILMPVYNSIGVKKINYLILTHGDYDHMGEAINLVNNFKVEKVIFNCGPYNDLEKELIKVLDKKKIKHYSCIKELNIDNNKLYFLQTKEYDNENDNSNVIYTELNGYKFMFMGDASSTTEKEILSKYNLPDIDVLKVGHHGSKTSSGKEFINAINPRYSVISVGKNNRYGHPNKEVLNNLDNSKIYRTDENGSIMFKIKNNRLKIETCSP